MARRKAFVGIVFDGSEEGPPSTIPSPSTGPTRSGDLAIDDDEPDPGLVRTAYICSS